MNIIFFYNGKNSLEIKFEKYFFKIFKTLKIHYNDISSLLDSLYDINCEHDFDKIQCELQCFCSLNKREIIFKSIIIEVLGQLVSNFIDKTDFFFKFFNKRRKFPRRFKKFS